MNDDQKRDVARRAQHGTLLDIFNAVEQAVVTELAASVPPLTRDFDDTKLDALLNVDVEVRAELLALRASLAAAQDRRDALHLRLAMLVGCFARGGGGLFLAATGGMTEKAFDAAVAELGRK